MQALHIHFFDMLLYLFISAFIVKLKGSPEIPSPGFPITKIQHCSIILKRYYFCSDIQRPIPKCVACLPCRSVVLMVPGSNPIEGFG